MHTLQQAKVLWCPMVRPAEGASSPVSLDGTGWNTCAGSACAMWRWADPAPELRDPKTWWTEDDFPKAEPARPAEVPADAVWVPLNGEGDRIEGGYWEEAPEKVAADNKRAMDMRRGYCGLAGRPEVR